MNPIYDRRIDHPAAWTSAEIGGKEGLTHRMGPEHVQALAELVERTRHLAPDAVTRADFDHPLINDLMKGVRFELMNGRGAIVLQGLDMSRTSLEDYSRIYWGLGAHLGQGAVQSYRGDRIGHVQKEEDNPTGRGYLMDVELRSHTDFHEILSLASFRKAPEGGESGVVSSLAIHNVLLEEAPHHLEALYEGFFHELAGTQQVTADKVPVFCNVDGKVSCYFHGLFQMAAAKTLGVPVPPELVEAQKAFSAIAARPDIRADFMLEPGEMLFWHNFLMLHSRTAFSDTPEQKRLLLRLWLNVPGGRPMHPSFTERARAMDKIHESGQAAIHYTKAGVLSPAPEPVEAA